jgi:putative DNA primase/helicase
MLTDQHLHKLDTMTTTTPATDPAQSPPVATIPPRMASGSSELADALKRATAYAAKLESVAEGGRNQAAYRNAGSLRAFGIPDEEVLALLRQWNQRNHPPIDDDELRATFANVQRYGDDRKVEDRPTRRKQSPRAGQWRTTATNEDGTRPPRAENDSGRCDIFVEMFGQVLRWAEGLGWLRFIGTHWERTNSIEIEHMAEGIPQEIARRMAEYADQEHPEAKRLAKLHKDGSKLERIRACVQLAKGRLPVKMSKLDQDPYAFNVANGTLDLRTGELRPHQQADFITKLCPINYNPDAPASRWGQFLAEILPADVANWMQYFFGYCLTGDITLQKFPVLLGGGQNGKSVFMDTMLHVMGDHAGIAPPKLLAMQDHEYTGHPTEFADLVGKRLIMASETEDGAVLRMQVVKQLTGDRRFKFRHMRQDFQEAERTFKVCMITNHRPRIDEDSEAVWRRVVVVPFDRTIDAGDVDPDLLNKLEAEAEGILAWLVEGAKKYFSAGGLPESAAIANATRLLRGTSTSAEAFIQLQIGRDPRMKTSGKEMYAAYEVYCLNAKITPQPMKTFNNTMRNYFEAGKTGDGLVWLGVYVKLQDDANDANDANPI